MRSLPETTVIGEKHDISHSLLWLVYARCMACVLLRQYSSLQTVKGQYHWPTVKIRTREVFVAVIRLGGRVRWQTNNFLLPSSAPLLRPVSELPPLLGWSSPACRRLHTRKPRCGWGFPDLRSTVFQGLAEQKSLQEHTSLQLELLRARRDSPDAQYAPSPATACSYH
ncbi:hypothetical protein BU16DRAFT_230702 [Lophium mytilinum]|uniref:Uncharacterized protein n=1 Tax=Lophium mytilinum TaxID=390894 RepID=A0A6A6Q8P9_9PEZI|nr:hypothetical protein BU16DRAFT_230702 [Lophium mytilinum]